MIAVCVGALLQPVAVKSTYAASDAVTVPFTATGKRLSQ